MSVSSHASLVKKNWFNMVNSSPLVSIIIPTYNIEGYIERAIKSALQQSYSPIEIIMIDDQSSDQTVAIAKAIQDPRLTIIQQPHNGGPSAARNKGLDIAKGEWIAILDGDDSYLPDRISKLLSVAEKEQADIVVDNLIVDHEVDKTQIPMFTSDLFKTSSRIDLTTFIKGNQLFLGGYTLGYLKPFCKASFLKTHHISYATDIRIGEDYLLMAECLAHGAKCMTLPSAEYLYTVRATSISHRLNEESVHRIEASDQIFLSKHQLTSRERSAQRKRTRKLRLALHFTQLVEAIKSKNIAHITRQVVRHPFSLLYLWRPIWARLKRFKKDL